MSGAGSMVFGSGPYGLADIDAASDTRGQLTSSRYLQADGTAKQTTDGTGAFVGMNDSFHRAIVMLAYGVELPTTINASFPAIMRVDVTAALAPLTDGDSPVLELVEVLVEENGRSLGAVSVSVRDLVNGGAVRTLQPFRGGY